RQCVGQCGVCKDRLVYRLAYDGDVAAGKGKRVGVSACRRLQSVINFVIAVSKSSLSSPDADTPIRQYANTPIRQYANTPIRQYANTPIRQYANTLPQPCAERSSSEYCFYWSC